MSIQILCDTVQEAQKRGIHQASFSRRVLEAALAEHAELEAENARLKSLLPLADDAVMKSIPVVENLKAENTRLRKVVDAVVAWYDCYHNVEAYPAAFYALVDAVREYRSRCQREATEAVIGG